MTDKNSNKMSLAILIFIFIFLTDHSHRWGVRRSPVLAHNDQFTTFCQCFRSQPSWPSSHHYFAWSSSTNERPGWLSGGRSQPMRDWYFLLPDLTNSPHLGLGPKYVLNKQNRSVLIFKISSGSPEYFKCRSFFNCWARLSQMPKWESAIHCSQGGDGRI